MSSPNIHGIIGYTITPFSSDGQRVDLDALGRSIDRLIASGVHAIAPLGSTGEGAYLSDAEWDEVSAYSLAKIARRVPTVVSVSDLTTAKAVRRARYAEANGADVVMVLPASYWKLSEAEILAHYAAIGDSIGCADHAVQQPGYQRHGHLHRQTDVPFYNGCNPLALEAFAAGAKGWCTAAPNLIPQLNLDLYDAVLANDLTKARALFYQQLPLLEFILKGGLPATIKAGLRLTGLDVGDPRLPVFPLAEAGIEQLKALLR
ncbi:hypothetical protein BHE74_00018386 [Ensete ventricosum]|nr:hypothetical protein BHE74_00018386 [Ensete ventricosum]